MMKNLSKLINHYYLPIIIVLISKILILVFINRLSVFLDPLGRASSLNIWNTWNVWDAPHYIFVSEFGYTRIGDPANFIVLLPLFPLSINLIHLIFHLGYLISGYFSSTIFSILLAIGIYKLTLYDYPKKYAIMTVLMLFIFPTSFFLHIPYTESLFLLLSVYSFCFVRRKYYLLSFICIGLATATKIVGLALIPAIFAELIFNKQYKVTILISGLLISSTGLIAYLLINYYVWGNPFYFTIIQRQHFFESFSLLGQGLIDSYKAISWRTGLEKIYLGYGQIFAFIFSLVMSIYVLFRIRLSYGLFMIISLFFYYSMSFWMCMMRYILTLFPMYIALALFSKNNIFRFSWITISSLLLIIFSLVFIQYGPIF